MGEEEREGGVGGVLEELGDFLEGERERPEEREPSLL